MPPTPQKIPVFCPQQSLLLLLSRPLRRCILICIPPPKKNKQHSLRAITPPGLTLGTPHPSLLSLFHLAPVQSSACSPCRGSPPRHADQSWLSYPAMTRPRRHLRQPPLFWTWNIKIRIYLPLASVCVYLNLGNVVVACQRGQSGHFYLLNCHRQKAWSGTK